MTNNIDDEKNALEKYSTILEYLAYENTTFWTRSGFYLVAQSALLGFIGSAIITSNKQTLTDARSWLIGFCLVGIILAISWILALYYSNKWIDKWHSTLIDIEPEAFGNIRLLRGQVKPGGFKSMMEFGVKTQVYLIAILFLIVWVMIFYRI